MKSLPAWGAWIEITIIHSCTLSRPSLPAWGAWIEIPIYGKSDTVTPRSPHGERGLKFILFFMKHPDTSLPAWGAWIEMMINHDASLKKYSLPAWGAWIEMGH